MWVFGFWRLVLFTSGGAISDDAYAKDTDRHAWAAHYLTSMSKAVVDDVMKVLERGPDRANTKSEK